MHTLPYVPNATGSERAAGMRVLVVDDEPAIRMVVARYLKARGHEVEMAEDGAEALQRILCGPGSFDRIFADLRMPGMRGDELYYRLAARGLGDRLVFITGDPGGDGVSATLEVPVLQKPFAFDELAALVEEPALQAA